MKIKVRIALLQALKKQGVDKPLVNEALRYSREDSFATMDLTKFTKPELDKLAAVAKANATTDTTATGVMRKVASYLSLSVDPTSKPVGTCEGMEMALKALVAALPNKWLFTELGDHWCPCFVRSVRYREPERDSPAHTEMKLEWVQRGTARSREVKWLYSDLRGQRNVEELLAAKGYVAETKSMVAAYAAEMVRYNDVWPRTGEQLAAVGEGRMSGSYWGSSRSMVVDGAPSKVVVDDIVEDEDDGKERPTATLPADTRFWDDLGQVDPDELDADSADSEAGQVLPVHPVVCVFRLENHEFYDVHVNDLSPWRWDAKLADKLVLAEEKKDLVDTLISAAGEVMEDIVAGKTGGVIVCASGPPGTGKTLTAEVYSEATKRPLYMVQCSQLGTDEEALERKLKLTLDRAARWKAILLIDEADVYIRERAADIQQNAIVGVFLRMLERYRGILFLTTNRATTIDDAIVSRFTAHVRYEMPTAAERERLWAILAANYKVELPGRLAETLAERHRISGRSIKNALKLASVYAKRKGAPVDEAMVAKLLRFQDPEGPGTVELVC